MRNAVFILLFSSSVLLASCSNSNEILEIEQANHYEWQKYMNSEEFAKIQDGMTYMDVVKIAGGAGKLEAQNEKLKTMTYIWLDERLLTHVYEIKFKNDEVVSKQVIERRGNSNRE